MFVAHHGYVIEPVHVSDGLVERFTFSKLLRSPVQQANVRISPHDRFAIHFKNQAQDPMCSRMLRAKVHGVISNFCHV